MLAKVQRWGNSLGLRIPRSFAAETNVEDGSVVDISIESGTLIVRPIKPRRYELKELLKQVRPETIHAEVDTGEPVGRELW